MTTSISSGEYGTAGDRVSLLSSYELRQLPTHLVAANRPSELHRLLVLQTSKSRNAWYEANVDIGNVEGFIEHVQLAWRLAQRELFDAEDTGSICRAVSEQARYALTLSAIRSLAFGIPGALIGPLVSLGMWPLSQGLALIAESNQWQWRLCAYLSLIGRKADADETLIEQALSELRVKRNNSSRDLVSVDRGEGTDLPDMPDEHFRCIVIQDLARRIPARHASALLAAANAIGAPWLRAEALAALAHLPAEPERCKSFAAAADAVRNIGKPSLRFGAWVFLISYLDEPSRSIISDAAWETLRALAAGDPDEQRFALIYKDGVISTTSRLREVEELVAAVRQFIRLFPGEDGAFEELAKGAVPLMKDVIHCALALEGPSARRRRFARRLKASLFRFFVGLYSCESSKDVEKALRAVDALPSPDSQSYAIARCFEHVSRWLGTEAVDRAFAIARDVNDEFKALAFEGVARGLSALPPAVRGTTVDRLVSKSEGVRLSYLALSALAPHLDEGQLRGFAERLRGSSSIYGIRRFRRRLLRFANQIRTAASDSRSEVQTRDPGDDVFAAEALEVMNRALEAAARAPAVEEFTHEGQALIAARMRRPRYGDVEAASEMLAGRAFNDRNSAIAAAVRYVAKRSSRFGMRLLLLAERLRNPRERAETLMAILSSIETANRAPVIRAALTAIDETPDGLRWPLATEFANLLRPTDSAAVHSAMSSILWRISDDFVHHALQTVESLAPSLVCVDGPKIVDGLTDTVDLTSHWWSLEPGDSDAEDAGDDESWDGSSRSTNNRAVALASLAREAAQSGRQRFAEDAVDRLLCVDPQEILEDSREFVDAIIDVSEASERDGNVSKIIGRYERAMALLWPRCENEPTRKHWVTLAYGAMYYSIKNDETRRSNDILQRCEELISRYEDDDELREQVRKAVGSIKAMIQERGAAPKATNRSGPYSPESGSGAGSPIRIDALLREAGLRFQMPEGFAYGEGAVRGADFAIISQSGSISVSYFVRREQAASPELAFADVFEALGIATGDLARFPAGSVNTEFAADVGGTRNLSIQPSLVGMALILQGSGSSDVCAILVYNRDPHTEVLARNAFYALTYARATNERSDGA